jgi:hypothetical protein
LFFLIYRKCLLKQGFYDFLKRGLNVIVMIDNIIIAKIIHIQENIKIAAVSVIMIDFFRDGSIFSH